MNEKHLKLFTPCSERLPEPHKHVLVIEDDTCDIHFDKAIHYSYRMVEWQIKVVKDSCKDYNGFNTCRGGKITHWLDLDSLTTKEAALQLARESYVLGGIHKSISHNENQSDPLNLFLEEKQKEL